MTNDTPIACSLDAGNLERRLAAIAAIGADCLISRDAEGGRHLLRFRAEADTQRRLEEIVTAEAECCTFLDLSLEDRGEELILTVAASQGGQLIADELAAAFAGGSA